MTWMKHLAQLDVDLEGRCRSPGATAAARPIRSQQFDADRPHEAAGVRALWTMRGACRLDGLAQVLPGVVRQPLDPATTTPSEGRSEARSISMDAARNVAKRRYFGSEHACDCAANRSGHAWFNSQPKLSIFRLVGNPMVSFCISTVPIRDIPQAGSSSGSTAPGAAVPPVSGSPREIGDKFFVLNYSRLTTFHELFL